MLSRLFQSTALAQLVRNVGGTDLTGLIVQVLVFFGVVAICGIAWKQLNLGQYVPAWALQIFTVVVVLAVALWAIRTFF